jgi:hypothetical protein
MYLSTTTWNLNPNPATGEELPFVASISTQDVPKQIERTSGRISVDWRFAPRDVLTIGFSEAYYEEWGMNRRFDVALGTNPVVIDRNFVQGRTGAGSTTSRGGGMSIKASTTWQPELKWTHNGPVWKFEGGSSYSHASFNVRSKGFMGSVPFNIGTFSPSGVGRVGPTVRFDYTGDYEELIPFNYEVVERFNEGEARLSGWEFAVDQRLDPYVPEWARGARIFFNTSYKAAPKGVAGGDLGAFSQRLVNWGMSYRRGPFSTHVKWNHVPEGKLAVFDPTATRPGSRTLLDVDVSYQFHPKIAFFASAANVMGKQRVSHVFTDRTPDYARARQYQYYGVAIVAGIKGQF